MENALVVSKTFVLGLKIHCKGCKDKLKKRLLDIGGVHRVAIDSKKGEVRITGTIDPPTLISILEKYSYKTVLLWEQPPTPKEDSIMSSRSTVNGDDNTDDQSMVQLIGGSRIMDQFDDSNMVRVIQQLSGGKEAEVTISRTVKVVFNDGKMKVVESTNSTTTGKNEKAVVSSNSVPAREEKTVMGTPYLGSLGGQHTCCCQYPGHMHNHNQHRPPPRGGAQPWVSSSSAPPPPIQYSYSYSPSPARPPVGYPPYQSAFSDDNVNGCVII